VTFDIPIRTVSALNLREHWRKRAKRVKSERQAAYLITPYGVRLPCTVKLTRIAPRALDGDNWQAGAKGIRDGIADKLGVDDRDPRVTWEYGQERGKPYAVRVTIT
jgi:hypothetical protein